MKEFKTVTLGMIIRAMTDQSFWKIKIIMTTFENGNAYPKITNIFVIYLNSDIVDIKPVNMEELTEVITAAEFHPLHCNLFMYSSSKGTIKLSDMRASALCDQHAKSE